MKNDFYGTSKDAIILDKIKNNKAKEKALTEFRCLSKKDKYKECVHYGNIMGVVDLETVKGSLTLKTMSIYDKKFLFILLAGQVIKCYELQ